MRTRFPLAIVATTTVAAVLELSGLTSVSRSQDTPVPPAPAPADPSVSGPQVSPPADGDDNLDGAEVLTRGPVHEAFASPTLLDPQATPTINKKPPDPIEEVPPDERPDGNNVIWIPGYWAWDDERNDFLWVSGLYRNAPPNQTWVSGYWTEVAGGYQWTPGFWTAAAQEDVTYLEDAPPATLEAGPSSPAPSDNHFWIPGCWMYQDVRYVWRPGYWAVTQLNWVWVPARYQWCPSGYVFIPGYWDYLPVSRGFLFAPVYFTQPIYYQPAFVYRPAVVISTGFFSANLFCRPAFCHYYFGDYFGVQYSNVGFRPWFSVTVGIGGRPCYDPFFAYYNCHNRRHDRDWFVHAQRRYDHLKHDQHARPPHTFASLQQDKGRDDRQNHDKVVVAKTLKDVKRDGNSGGMKVREVDHTDRDKFVKQATEFKKVAKERGEIEKKSDVARTPQNVDRRRSDDGKAVVKVSDKKLKLPTVAKVDSPTRGRGNNLARDDASRATDAAKKNNPKDSAVRTTGPRLVDSNKPTAGSDLKKQDVDRAQTTNTNQNPGGGGAKQAIDRARSSTSSLNSGATTGPALTQSDAVKRQSSNKDSAARRASAGTGNPSGNTVGKSQSVLTPPGGNAVTTPRNSANTTQSRSRTSSASGGADSNRAMRNLQPQTQSQQVTPRSSQQPKTQPRTNPPSSGGSSGSKSGDGDKERTKRRSGKSADAGVPRSNIDLSMDSPNVSTITRSVDEELKADRDRRNVAKDEWADRARDEVRGAPREDIDATAKRSAAPSGDWRVPSIYGPANPNERDVAQSDNGGPVLGPADGNRDIDAPARPERRSFATTENDASRSGMRPRNSTTENREFTDGARPGRAPVSRYDNLIQHGQVLSRATVRERPGTVDEEGNVDPRKAKNPIGSIGFGATPRRFGTPRTYGPQGQSSGSGSTADATKPRGGGSLDTSGLPRWQSSQRPQLPRLQRSGAP